MVSDKERSQRGVALLMALIALLMVTSIALCMMFATDTESSINSNFRDEKTAYYAAKAGLEEARDRMRTGATNGISASLPTAKPGAANGVLYILNPTGSETVAPWSTTNAYFDNEICKEVDCAGGQVPPTSGWYVNPALTASTAYAASQKLAYKWMRVTLKTNRSAAVTSVTDMYVDGNSANANYYVCWNGTNEIASSSACASPNIPVYMLTTLAVTPSGTRRMLQYETYHPNFNFQVPSGLTLDGTGDSMSGLDSNPYQMDGADHAGCGGAGGGTPKPAIGVTNDTDKTTVINGIPSNRLDHYTGSGGVTPDVENISSSLPANFQSVTSLEALLATIKSSALVLTGNQTSLSNPGTAASPQIIYVDGDLTLTGNVTGYGILVVTGTFSPGGNVGWKGIVLVVGQGIMTGNGGGNNEYDGAVVIAKTRDSSGNLLSSLGGATFNYSGGGGNGIYYSSGCVSQSSGLAAYRVISTHELLY